MCWLTADKSTCLGEVLLKAICFEIDQVDGCLLIDYLEILVTGVNILVFLYLNGTSIILLN